MKSSHEELNNEIMAKQIYIIHDAAFEILCNYAIYRHLKKSDNFPLTQVRLGTFDCPSNRTDLKDITAF